MLGNPDTASNSSHSSSSLRKSENFAVSLRRQRKEQILSKKRQ